LVDIKELVQTYAVINNPKVKEVTTKFGALLLGLGVATLGVWGMVTLAEEDTADDAYAASSGETSDEQLASDQVRDCVPEERADAWRQDNADVILSDRLISTETSGDYVCFIYTN
jgi:hypothetical protein